MANRMPWFKYILDEAMRATEFMPLADCGIYHKLLVAIWERGGELPCDVKKLSKITGIYSTTLRKHLAKFQNFYENYSENSEGDFTITWIKDGLSLAEKKSDKSRLAAEKRWKPTNADAYTDAYTNVSADASADAYADKDIDKDKDLNTLAQKSEQEEMKKHIQQNFEIFWKHYPKKKAKKDACKAFCSIFKGKKPEDVQIILNNLGEHLYAFLDEARAKIERDGNDQYVPYPASWLRANDFTEPLESHTESMSGYEDGGYGALPGQEDEYLEWRRLIRERNKAIENKDKELAAKLEQQLRKFNTKSA